jgi:hypothetical protein
MNGQVLFKGEIRFHKNVKIGWDHFKIFFTRTTCPSLTRLDTNHPWKSGIQVCSNEGDSPFPRGDNSKQVEFLKIFSRTSRPKSIKLGTIYPLVKEIQVCSNKGPGPLQRGDHHKNVKIGWGLLRIFSRTTGSNFNQTWHKSSF